MPSISVIICTYNPNLEILEHCLTALSRAASLCKPLEILIIDNNSKDLLSETETIRRFARTQPETRVIREEKQGLTQARLRGIRESTGDILVFIDDDNFIDENYLVKGLEIAVSNPHVASWSGQVKLKFEHEPESWTKKYWGLLVFREFDDDRWSNLPHLPETMPCGAGLFVTRQVADHYRFLNESGKRKIQLDRSAESLFSAGDNDLAACACDIGLGVGLFHELVLDHYIPQSRLRKEYLLRLAQGIAASTIVFKSFRNEYPAEVGFKTKLANQLRLLLKNKRDNEFYKAVLKGEKSGYEMVLKLKSNPGGS